MEVEVGRKNERRQHEQVTRIDLWRGPVYQDVGQKGNEVKSDKAVLPDQRHDVFADKIDGHQRPGEKMVEHLERKGEQVQHRFLDPEVGDGAFRGLPEQRCEYRIQPVVMCVNHIVPPDDQREGRASQDVLPGKKPAEAAPVGKIHQQGGALKNDGRQAFQHEPGSGQQVGVEEQLQPVLFLELVVDHHKAHENHPGKAGVDEGQHRIPEQHPPAGDVEQGVQESRFGVEMLPAEIVDGAAEGEREERGRKAGGKLIDAPRDLKEGQQYPVVQRGLVVVENPVQGGRDVVAGKFHLQRHQRADAFIVDEGQQPQVDQQGRRQQGYCGQVEPAFVCQFAGIQNSKPIVAIRQIRLIPVNSGQKYGKMCIGGKNSEQASGREVKSAQLICPP